MDKKLFSEYNVTSAMIYSIRQLLLNGNPYIEEMINTKSIFVHIPKNAGISIEKAVYDEKVGHHRYLEYAIMSPSRAQDYFSFSFVRNPWSRVLSAFKFLKKGGRNPTDKSWAKKNLSKFDYFEEFVSSLRKESFKRKILSWQHFTPQMKYLININGEIGVDYVGRVEKIEKDFKKIGKKLGVKKDLPHLNKSTKKNYKNKYSKKSKNIIKEVYKQDIKAFGYIF